MRYGVDSDCRWLVERYEVQKSPLFFSDEGKLYIKCFDWMPSRYAFLPRNHFRIGACGLWKDNITDGQLTSLKETHRARPGLLQRCQNLIFEFLTFPCRLWQPSFRKSGLQKSLVLYPRLNLESDRFSTAPWCSIRAKFPTKRSLITTSIFDRVSNYSASWKTLILKSKI